MGVFKRESKFDIFINYLLKLDFERRTGAQGQDGYTRIWCTDEGLHYVWVTINLNKKKIYIYQEYNCGGETGNAEHDILDEWLDDLDVFVEEVDKILGRWISEDDE